MNREILFKAKRKNNGEWVEGGCSKESYTDKEFIVRWNSYGLGFNEFIEVNPDTICQYTGLIDKNGKKIWENDIVRWRFKRVWKEEYHISKVVWDDFCSAFKLTVPGGLAKLRNDIEYEVLGNTFDNLETPEMEE